MFHAIKNQFATDEILIKRKDLYKVNVTQERVFELLRLLQNSYEYKILNAITCTDWIEEGHFTLTYIVSTMDRKNSFMVQTNINRQEAHIDTLSGEFAQAEIFERDLHEMFGINFVGNKNLQELSLENWVHTPPLRREFDTLEFVNTHLTFREGREDNMDVKVEMKRIRAEKKAAKAAALKAKEEAETKEESKDGK